MCGYCIERVMIELLEQELCSKAPNPEDQGSAMLLESYAQETGFPMRSLKFARECDKESDILYVLHCRALEEIAASPATTAEGSPPHNALIKHYHAYRRMTSSRFKTSDLENILPHPSWLILYDPDFVFAKAKQSEFMTNPDLLDQCAVLLEKYHSWWLKGERQLRNDLNQRLEETGIMDPIEDIASSEWKLFYNLFPAIYFALIYLSWHGEDLSPVENVILTDVNGVPDFPGFDLWLQRKAFIYKILRKNCNFLYNNIASLPRPLLAFYAYLKLKSVRKDREQLIHIMENMLEHFNEYGDFVEEVGDYLEKLYMHSGTNV